MDTDPGEMNNLAVNSSYTATVENMRWRLKMWCQETNDTFPIIEPDYIRGDLNQDDNVDLEDFAEFSNKWKNTEGVDCGGADFNGDGQISQKDLSAFTNHWLDSI